MKYLAVLSITAFACLNAEIGVVEEIVAKVNGDIVTRGDLERSRRETAEGLRAQGMSAGAIEQAMSTSDKDVLRDRIDRLLLVEKAKDLNINVDSELTKYMAELQRDSKIADPEKFQDYVKQQTGEPYEDFRSETKNTMLTQRVVRQEVSGKMKMDPAELKAYYEQHKSDYMREEKVYLREILVSSEGKDAAGVAAAEKKARDLVTRARKGERFAELARDNSDAITSKNMGELGGFKHGGELNKAIEDQVWDKPRGYITDPIRVDSGFLILRVDEHQKAGQAELSEVQEQIMEKLYAPKMQPEIRQYLTKLREDAFLQIKPGYVDTGAAPGKNTAWSDPAQLKPETVTKAEVSTKPRHKKLLFVPIPGTTAAETSSSR